MREEILTFLRANARLRIYAPGEMIFCQGDEATEMFYLESGVSLTYAVLENGQERNVLITWPGRMFGGSTYFEGVSRRTSAIALRECRVLVISKAVYDACCRSFPDFPTVMLREISIDLGVMFEQLVDSSLFGVDVNVARFLCRRMAGRQSQTVDGRPVLKYTQEFIARILGVSRLSVNKALANLGRQALVSVSYGTVTVLDPAALRRFAYGPETERA